MSEELLKKIKQRKTTTKQNMKSQILSMLEGVIDEDQNQFQPEDEELKDTIFFNEDSEEEDEDNNEDLLFKDEEETNTNTTDVTQTTFIPSQNEKAQTMKAPTPFFCKNNMQDILTRQQMFPQKKFQTQEYNPNVFSNFNLNSSFNQGFKKPQQMKKKPTPSIFFINKMNNINVSTVPIQSIPQQIPSVTPINNNQVFNIRSNYNSPINMKNQPMNMNMPMRNYNFKKAQSNPVPKFSFSNQMYQQAPFFYMPPTQNQPIRTVTFPQSLIINKSGLILDDPVAVELDSMLSQYNKFTFDLYLKLKGTFISLIKSQQTSRVCQFYIEQSPNEVVHLIFTEVCDSLPQLLLDPYANYFCLKLFYYLNSNDRMIFLKNISSYISNLSINKIATYPIQCIVEHLTLNTEKMLILNAIYPFIMKMSLDVYGTHVIEKVLSYFEYEMIKPISNFILDNFLFLANNSNGLCIVKKEIALEFKNENFERLKSELYNNAMVLIQNPYGNYALQMSIALWGVDDVKEIIETFYGKCSVLSIQKYSSNVIERCLEKSVTFLENFVNEICSNEGTIGLLMKNNYGNYVIQTALKVSKSSQQQMIINSIEKNLIQLNDKKLINKWKSIISAHSLYLN